MGRRAVVVGSGLGGLAAALRLRALGWDVEVVEALDQPGGRARVFERAGHRFDAGPTVITAPQLFEELFALHGRCFSDAVRLVPVDPFYRLVFPDGGTFDYVADEERLCAQIEAIEPRDVAGYRRLAAHARRVYELGYERYADRPFLRKRDMARVMPALLAAQSQRSVYSVVARYVRNDRLRQAFSFEPLLVGGHPFRVSSLYLLIHWLSRRWGVWHALGGTASIVRALVELLAAVGVDLHLNEAVERIEVRNGRAIGVVTSKRRIPCDVVVANADPGHVYGQLIEARHRPRHSDRMLSRVRPSMSLFVGYFGVDCRYDALAHHSIVLGPRYRGLLDDIFARRVLAPDFSLYLHAPTRTDPQLAPAGGETFYVLSPVPNNGSGINWQAEREPYFDRILESLESRLLPGLRAHMTTRFSLTPLEFEQDLRSVQGAAFGPEPVLWQSAYLRFHNRSPDVGGLYFVGAGTHPGAGVPGVLNSARILDALIGPAPGNAQPVPEVTL